MLALLSAVALAVPVLGFWLSVRSLSVMRHVGHDVSCSSHDRKQELWGNIWVSLFFSGGCRDRKDTNQANLHQKNLGSDDKICFFTILKPFNRHMSYQQTF